MNVKVAAQTLSASVADAFDFLHDEIVHPGFMESEATSEFIKRIDLAFDLMNSHHPLSKGIKQPVTCPYLKRYWAKACDTLTDYIFTLKDERGNLCYVGQYVDKSFRFSLSSLVV